MKNQYFLKTTNIGPDKVYPLLKIFKNLEKSKTIRILIPDKIKRIYFLKNQRIVFSKKCSCCNVLNKKYITFPHNYWNDSSPEGFYLDIIHELTHCIQRDKENIDFKKLAKKYEYWENPKELEAYAYSLLEAKSRKIPLNKFRIYLDENDFITKKQRKLLYQNILKFRIIK